MKSLILKGHLTIPDQIGQIMYADGILEVNCWPGTAIAGLGRCQGIFSSS